MLKKIEALLTLSITVLLSIIIGFAIGLLAAALYFIPIYQNKLTFADIGGMLAGFGTIGLLIVAIRTANSWREQLNEAAKRESLDQFYETSLLSHWSLIQHITLLKEFSENNKNTLGVHTKASSRQMIETTTKHNIATSKLKVHWNDLVIQGTTPMDLIALYKKLDLFFSENDSEEAYKKALNSCIEFQKIFTDAYFQYGSTLTNKT